jgi:hypothetical protein
MNTGSESAEQMVRIMFQGVEVALKLGGSGVKNLAQLIYASVRNEKNLNTRSGEVRKIASLLRENKPLQTYKIDIEDLQQFKRLAKKYGVLYTAVKDTRSEDGQCTIILKQEEVPMLNQILDDMGLKGASPKEKDAKKNEAQSEKGSSFTKGNTSDRAANTKDLGDIVGGINSGDKSKFTPENWKAFLRTQASLHNYSDKNRELIAEQMPSASLIMSKSKWRELGRFPSKDSKGIEIVRPETIDGKSTGQYVSATVYDISQTYGRQIRKSEVSVNLKEGSNELSSEIDRLKAAAPVPVETVKNLETKGVYDKTQRKILLREGISQTDAYKELATESVYANAHQTLGDGFVRGEHRITAESTAYALMDKNGMDTSSFTFDYIPDEVNGLDGKDVSELVYTTKVSVADRISRSEKSLEKHKTKQKHSVQGKLQTNKERVKTQTKAKAKEKTK